MLKIVVCVRRQPHLSREEFQNYWLENHGPLVQSLKDVLPIERYVQSHNIAPVDAPPTPGTPQEEPYDGITEVWIDETNTAMTTDEVVAANERLYADERTFVDQSRSCIFTTVEHDII